MKIQYTVTIDPRDVKRITPENLLAYALRTGWVEHGCDSSAALCVHRMQQRYDDAMLYVSIVSPVSHYCAARAHQHAVERFAEVEQRDPRDIVRDIVGTSASEANEVAT